MLASAVVFSHSFDLVYHSRAREPLDRLFHTYYAGDIAADAFFVLSGYLVLLGCKPGMKVGRFLARRALRIYPGFIAVNLICAFVLGPIFGGGMAAYFEQFQLLPFLWGVVTLREPILPPVFLHSPYSDADGTLWMIQFQFMCYLLVALAAAIGMLRRPAFWWTLWLAAMVLNLFCSDALNAVRFPGANLLLGDEPASFVRFLNFFVSGILFYEYRDRIPYRSVMAAAAAVLVFVGLFRFETAKLLLPSAGGYLLFWLAFARLPAIPGLEKLRDALGRNDITYGMFLYGWPVQQVLIATLNLGNPWLLTVCALPIAAACAWLSLRLLERRFTRNKPDIRPVVA